MAVRDPGSYAGVVLGASVRVLFLLALAACTDPTAPADKGDSGGTEEGFCGVQSILASQCVACHSASGLAGGLDLQTDAHAALVGVPSSLYAGRTLVVAGDPDGSFLLAKLAGTQTGSEGGIMPPGGALPDADVAVVRAWIEAGATEACETPDSGADGYHPVGWDDPTQHGMAAKHQEDDCQSCHGEDLTGGTVGVSCNMCHDVVDSSEAEGAWKTDCLWCHGGVDNTTGAPPEGISDETDASETSFPPHTTHVEATRLKSALDCVQCHTKPTDVFSPGHLFDGDTTPGVADVRFAAGLSDAASWSGGTCSNVYCHGDGQGDNGRVSIDSTVDCGSCHAVRSSGEDAWERMSGDHDEHIDEGVQCSECHGEVVDSRDQIVDVALHVNGTIELRLPSGVTRVGNSCTGSCHGEGHSGSNW